MTTIDTSNEQAAIGYFRANAAYFQDRGIAAEDFMSAWRSADSDQRANLLSPVSIPVSAFTEKPMTRTAPQAHVALSAAPTLEHARQHFHKNRDAYRGESEEQFVAKFTELTDAGQRRLLRFGESDPIDSPAAGDDEKAALLAQLSDMGIDTTGLATLGADVLKLIIAALPKPDAAQTPPSSQPKKFAETNFASLAYPNGPTMPPGPASQAYPSPTARGTLSPADNAQLSKGGQATKPSDEIMKLEQVWRDNSAAYLEVGLPLAEMLEAFEMMRKRRPDLTAEQFLKAGRSDD